MAKFIVSLFVALAALLLAGSVRAEGSVMPQPSQVYTCTSNSGAKGHGASASAACSQVVPPTNTAAPGDYSERVQSFYLKSCASNGCEIWSKSVYPNCAPCNGGADADMYSFFFPVTFENSVGCPENSSNDIATGKCNCNSGYSPDAAGQACTAACGPVNGVASSGYYDVGTVAGASPKLAGCKGGCSVYFDGVSPAGSAMEGGVKHWYAKGSYHYSGTKCTAAAEAGKQVGEAKPAVPSDTCAPGQGSATMNGKTVCVDQDDKPTEESTDKSSTKTEKTTTTNPDGSTTTTETTTKTDANGNKEVTVTRTTVRTDGTSTTETETTKPPGSGDLGDKPGDEGEEEGECAKNPSAAGCGGEPSTVGDLYTPKEKTMSGVLTAARDQFMSSPVGSAVGGFFVVTGGGSCPSWNAHIPYIEADLTIDQFCSSFATQALALLKLCLLVVASFYAFRIAVE